MLQFARVETPIGAVLVFVKESAVCGLAFEDEIGAMKHDLNERFGGEEIEDAPDPAGAASALAGYFAGDLDALGRVEVETGGTPFEREVYRAVRHIPPGKTMSYSQVAIAVSRPDAVRAVGAANAKNPVALFVPCHRVVGSDGSLTGYGGGLHRKEWLLRHEHALF